MISEITPQSTQPTPKLDLIFLGTAAALQLPSFHCTCDICEAARADPGQQRTRASVALLGEETVLIDAGPDLEAQLEREGIRQIDRIFITHWHYDHIAGLPGLGEPARIGRWPPIALYLPAEVAHHFDQELAYLRGVFDLHPIQPGDRFDLPDGTWEVVKTTHTDHSVGFVVGAGQRFAYLVDGVTPPRATMARLQDLDFVVLEATMDELDEAWLNFSLGEAVACWRRIGADRCILTHLSCHSWRDGKLIAGMSHTARAAYEAATPGLTFAYDSLRVSIRASVAAS
ncbi:MAG: MBL fold metallo-hydrolase [Anaerolineae bacterium]